jgi:DNA repair protein RadC
MPPKMKFDYKLLKNMCDEGNVKLLVDYENAFITRDTRIIGKCICCENNFNKCFNDLNRYKNFTCVICTKSIKFTRIKETMLQNYGVEYAAKSEIFRDKMMETTFERYGVEHALQHNDVKTKSKETKLEKYGLNNEDIKNKRKLTNLKKYGVENAMQNKQVRENARQTTLKRYGVEHVSQHPEIMEKMTTHMYKFKEYITPSGNILKLQGYEHYALDSLFQKENILEQDIITGCKNVPTIWYDDVDGKRRRHYVDIFIPSQNRCIEVKSTWTAKLNNHTIFLKQEAAKKLGYKYEIWIYNSKGELVEFHK